MDDPEDVLAIVRCHNFTPFNEEEVKNSDMGQWISGNKVAPEESNDVENGCQTIELSSSESETKKDNHCDETEVEVGQLNAENPSIHAADCVVHSDVKQVSWSFPFYLSPWKWNLFSSKESNASTQAKRSNDGMKTETSVTEDIEHGLYGDAHQHSQFESSVRYESECNNADTYDTEEITQPKPFNAELQPDKPAQRTNNEFDGATERYTELQRENTKLKSELDNQTQQVMEYKETMARRYQQMEDTLAEKNAEVSELHMVEDRLQRKVFEVQAELLSVKVEKEDAQQRLSELMSSRLRDNNPNIVDLSDQYRPNKLGEMMNELYDNQWTNLFSYLEDNWVEDDEFPERDCTQILLTIVMETYSDCSEKVIIDYEKAMNHLFGLALSDMDPELFKMIKDCRKRTAFETLPNVREVCIPRLKQLALEDPIFKTADLNSAEVNDYIDECMKLCWLMVLQDPPIYLHCEGWKSKLSVKIGGDKNIHHTDHVSALPITENVVEVTDVYNQAVVLEGQVQHSTINENQTSSEKQEQDENFQRSLANDASVIPEQDINKEIDQDNTKFDIEPIISNNNTNEPPVTTDDITNEDQPFTTLNTINKGDQGSVECDDEDAITDDVMQRVPFSKDHYREYTKRGPFIDYIVWPVMYLHKDGPILNKGVAQGCK